MEQEGEYVTKVTLFYYSEPIFRHKVDNVTHGSKPRHFLLFFLVWPSVVVSGEMLLDSWTMQLLPQSWKEVS